MSVMESGIYRIDLGNGHFYIGSSVDLAKRKKQHLNLMISQKHENPRIQNCWNKYHVFEFMVLEKCEIPDLLFCEQLLIDKYFSNPKNVNLAPTAGSVLGAVRSAETRSKISAAGKGRVFSAEARAKMSAASKGKPKSAEHCAKISDARKGKVFSTESRLKMSNAHKGKTPSAETRAKISAAGKGRVFSAEARAKISASNRLRHKKADVLDQPTQNLGTPNL